MATIHAAGGIHGQGHSTVVRSSPLAGEPPGTSADYGMGKRGEKKNGVDADPARAYVAGGTSSRLPVTPGPRGARRPGRYPVTWPATRRSFLGPARPVRAVGWGVGGNGQTAR